MKISYNWLKQYVDIDKPADEVAEILTDIGLEVEGLVHYKGPGEGLEGLIVGLVKERIKHPDADRLSITKVDVGGSELLQIICGAPNVEVGQKVAVAMVGAKLYPKGGDSFAIKKAKIRGIESYGMICAEDEIGLGDNHDGILVLSPDAKIGQPLSTYLKIEDDYIFEIGLTPNRADATGHIGVARDLAAAISVRENKDIVVQWPKINEQPFDSTDKPVEVIIENNQACPRYSGILIEGIEIKDSPGWLQERLRNVGVRPINNIVDITNFILQEYGQPLHAFDSDEIKGNKVIVKNLSDKSKFLTLDEVERTLSGQDLMICNEEGGMCIAGVFGGLHSGVKQTTNRIFLESAYFNPVSIRKTSTRHLLRTDAATRFEKGTDPNITVVALKRAVQMITEMANGKVASQIVDVYPKQIQNFNVEIEYANVNRLIGTTIKKEEIKNILTRLSIEIVTEKETGLELSVPPFKVDVQREVDVIEEILRIYGFNNVPLPEQLRTSLSYADKSDKKNQRYNSIADYLAANGFNEMMANSISQSKYYENGEEEQNGNVVKLLKSSNADLNVMRSSMLFSGLEAVAYNVNRRNADLKLFEFGKSYHASENAKYQETEFLTLLISGNKQEDSWIADNDKIDFFYLKSYVERILKKLGIEKFEVKSATKSFFSQGLEYFSNESALVTFGLIDNQVCSKMDIKIPVYYAEFNWGKVLSITSKRNILFSETPKFPGIKRDLSLLLNKQIAYSEIQKIAIEEGKRILKSVNLFDIYQDKKLGTNVKSYAVSYFFQDEHKTLTDKDVDKLMKRLIERYKNDLQAEIR